MLFDAKMKPLANLGVKNFGGVYYEIATNRFYSLLLKAVVNEQFDIVTDMAKYTNIAYLNDVKLFSLSLNGKYGLIKPTGEIILPFQYDRAFSFYNGLSYNVDLRTNTPKLFAPTGAPSALANDSDVLVRSGILVEQTLTHRIYKNYLGQTLVAIDNSEALVQPIYDYYSQPLGLHAGTIFVTNKAGSVVMYVLS